MRALIVLSGGQDSTTAAFVAKQHCDELYAVTFNYGQRHLREVDSAVKVASMLGVHHHEIVTLPKNILHSTSPLVSSNDLEQYSTFHEMDRIIGNRVEKTFVPMRNTLFLTLAANRAVEVGARRIYLGVCEADNANYPDCTTQFIADMYVAINSGLGNPFDDIAIEAPLLHLPKHVSIELAMSIPDAYDALAWTHTAYDGTFPPSGADHATVLRAHGFELAGVPDPLIVRAWLMKLCELPDTVNYDTLRNADFSYGTPTLRTALAVGAPDARRSVLGLRGFEDL